MTMLIALVLAAAAHPCADDAQRYCKDVKPGEGRVLRCLKEHEAQLSDACREKREDYREGVHAAMEACGPDAEKLCKDVKPGGGRVVACLKQHEAELSPECKAVGGKIRERRGEGREKARELGAACRGDAQKLCAGIKPGGGRIIECLKQHEADVSPGCASELR